MSREDCTEGLCSGSLNMKAPCRAVVISVYTAAHSVLMSMAMDSASSSQVLYENLLTSSHVFQ